MKIIGMGDSLMQFNSYRTFPQSGWLQLFSRFLRDPNQTPVIDFAVNGMSTKSFIESGQYKKALDAAEAGDVFFISFGHNDEKEYDPSRYAAPETDYAGNLELFYKDIHARKGICVFLSPVARLVFEADRRTLKDTHGLYPEAMRKTARRLGAYYIDLGKLTKESYQSAGPEKAKRFVMTFGKGRYGNYPEGLADTSHLTYEGAYNICCLLQAPLREIACLKDILS